MPSVRVLLNIPIDEYNGLMQFMAQRGDRFVSPVVREFIKVGMKKQAVAKEHKVKLRSVNQINP